MPLDAGDRVGAGIAGVSPDAHSLALLVKVIRALG